jgi:hypothetical protein
MMRIESTCVRAALTAIGAALLLWGAHAMATEEPEYRVVETYPEFELRRYAPYLVAETEVTGQFDGVGSQAFRILADYIFGKNRAQTKMEMTAPVSQKPAAEAGERIAMTAPVTQQPASAAEADSYRVSFVMPSGYTLETLPEPEDPRVQLREVPGRLMAARRYSGRWTEANYRENEAALLRAVDEAGLTPIADPVYARYNSPFSLWFLRRNEVLVEVEAPDSP